MPCRNKHGYESLSEAHRAIPHIQQSTYTIPCRLFTLHNTSVVHFKAQKNLGRGKSPSEVENRLKEAPEEPYMTLHAFCLNSFLAKPSVVHIGCRKLKYKIVRHFSMLVELNGMTLVLLQIERPKSCQRQRFARVHDVVRLFEHSIIHTRNRFDRQSDACSNISEKLLLTHLVLHAPSFLSEIVLTSLAAKRTRQYRRSQSVHLLISKNTTKAPSSAICPPLLYLRYHTMYLLKIKKKVDMAGTEAFHA